MNIALLVPSVAVFLGIIFTLQDWTPKHGVITFVKRSVKTSAIIFVISVVLLAIILSQTKGI